MANIRPPNIFEKLLLAIGLIVVIVGYGLIHSLVAKQSAISWDLVITVFLWFVLIIMIVITSVTENLKEELAEIIKKETEKLRMLRQNK